MTSRDSPPDQDLASSYFCDSPQGFGVVECGPLRAQARPRSVRGRRASRALRRRPEVMFFAPFIRRAPTARLCQVAIARGALSVRHRARGQVEDGGRRVPHSSQPDDLLSARTPSPAAHPRHERRPRLHPSLQPRRGHPPGTVGWLRPTVRGDAGHRGGPAASAWAESAPGSSAACGPRRILAAGAPMQYDHDATSASGRKRASVVQGKTSTSRWEMQVQGLPGALTTVPSPYGEGTVLRATASLTCRFQACPEVWSRVSWRGHLGSLT